MPSAQIILTQGMLQTQPSFSTDQIVLNTLITLTNANNTGVITWFWYFVDIPQGSSAIISNSTQASASFTPDIAGTYLIKLSLNGGAQWNQIGAAVKTSNLNYRIPAIAEELEFDNFNTNQKGWGPAINNALRIIDDGYGNILNNAVLLSPPESQTGNIQISGDGLFSGNVQVLESLDTFGPSTLKIGTGSFGSTTGVMIGNSNIDTVMPTNLGMSEGKAIRFESIETNNWSLGKNLSLFTKTLVSSSSLDIVIADSLNQGFVIGADGGNSALEVRSDGYAYLSGSFICNGNMSINNSNYIQFHGRNNFNWLQGIDIPYTKQNIGTNFGSSTIDILVDSGVHNGFSIGNNDGYSMLELNKDGSLYLGVLGTDSVIDTIDMSGVQNLNIGRSNAGDIFIGNATHSTVIGVVGTTTHLSVNPTTIGMISTDGLAGISVTTGSSVNLWSTYGILADGYIAPVTNAIYNLGSTSKQWKDGYFAGKLVLDGYRIDLSTGVNSDDTIIYNGTSFIPHSHNGGQQVINSSGSIVIDPTAGNMCLLGSTGNITNITISDGKLGQIFTLDMFQGDSSHTWPTTISNTRIAGGNFIKSSTIQNIDTITFRWNGIKTRWDEISRAILLS